VVEFAYSIELQANQESVSIGDMPVKMAKAIHPESWEFWEGREALFDHLVVLVRNRVNLEFPGEARAAREVLSILKGCKESKVMDLLPQLSGSHLYHVYLAEVHGRLLHRVIATGGVERIEHNPTGTVAFDPLTDVAEMVIKSADRISIRELAKYLERFHIGLRRVGDTSSGVIAPVGTRKQVEGVNEIRGRLILDQLELLGYDPMDMEYEKGTRTPGIKDEVKERIWELKPQEFAHLSKGFDKNSYETAFKHAWDWLRGNDLILHLPAKKK
jgi:hypothetical protein